MTRTRTYIIVMFMAVVAMSFGEYEIFRAGAATFYMSKEHAVAYEVTNGAVSRGLYFERID